MKPDNGNGVAILDQKLYNDAIQETIPDTSNFENLNEDSTLKYEASLQSFLCKLKQKVLTKMNMINCILLLLLLLVSIILLKCTNSHLVIHFLNFV